MTPLEKVFGKMAQLVVLEYLIINRGETTYLSGIAEGTGLSHSSVSRVIGPLLENNVITEKKRGKHIRTFVLNEENDITKLIIKFYNDLKKELDD